ncbi:22317_t:CDS:1, partial [Dentiscutata erythropus]
EMTTQKIEWNEKLRSVRDKSFYSLDTNIHKTITEQEKYRKDFIKNDSSLTENEKKFLFSELQDSSDAFRIGDNS